MVSRPNRLASPANATTARGKAAAAGEIARDVSARDPESALALAEEVLGRALRIGATEAEVLVMAGDSALTRFANSEIHQNVAERSLTVSLRHVVGRRIAVVSTGRVDAEGLRSLVHRAAAIARSCEELDDWAGLPAPPEATSRKTVSAWADGTAEATPEFRAEGVRAVIAGTVVKAQEAHGRRRRFERLPEHAALDVVRDVTDVRVAELRVAQS